MALGAGLVSFALMRSGRGRRIVGTWSCGYIGARPRMQYTGSSFGSVLVGLFRFLLHPTEALPTIRGVLPMRTAYKSHIDDLVLDRWLLPMFRRFADHCDRIRKRQSIRTQASIVYVVGATLGMLFLVVPVTDIVRRLLTR